MKPLRIEIHNFVKIQHALLEVKPFTLIAGRNASGKSSITRSLCTLFRTLNKDHLTIDFDASCEKIAEQLDNIEQYQHKFSKKVRIGLDKLLSAHDILINAVDHQFSLNTPSKQNTEVDNYRAVLLNNLGLFALATDEFAQTIGQSQKYSFEQHYIKQIKDAIEQLDNLLKRPSLYLSSTLTQQLIDAFTRDFQVTKLSYLKNKRFFDQDSHFFLTENRDFIMFGEGAGLGTQFNAPSIEQFQRVENVIYLESPILWAYKDIFTEWVGSKNKAKERRTFKNQQRVLHDIPQYILDTFKLLDRKVIEEHYYPDLIEVRKQIEKLIGGRIQIDSFGKIQFIEIVNEHDVIIVDINQISSGIKALGMLALLLEKQAITKGTLLIFDEPEVNLHPAWQHVMVQVLYKLSLVGVTIIMASHSYDMLEAIEQCMEKHLQNNDDLISHFSVVQIQNGTTVNGNKPLFKKLDAVKADLGQPIYDLFVGE